MISEFQPSGKRGETIKASEERFNCNLINASPEGLLSAAEHTPLEKSI